MHTDYRKISETKWKGVEPIKIDNPEPKHVYVNEHIADGSKIGKDSYILHCRLGNNVVVDNRCVVGDYSIAGNNVTFKYKFNIGNRCVFGDNAHFHQYGHIGKENEFGDNVTFMGTVIVEDGNFFGDGAKFGRESRFISRSQWGEIFREIGAEFGNNGKFDHCHFQMARFGDNALLINPTFYGSADIGNHAELIGPDFDTEDIDTIQLGYDTKIYYENKILTEHRHLLPKFPKTIKPGGDNIVVLLKKIDIRDHRRTKWKEDITDVYPLEKFLSMC